MAENPSDIKWGCCQLGLQADEEVVRCAVCATTFHQACLSPVFSVITDHKWVCEQCTGKHKNYNNEDTPVRSNPNVNTARLRRGKRQALNSPDSPEDDTKKPITSGEMKSMFSDMEKSLLQTMTKVFHSELKTIKDEIGEIRESMTYMNSRYEEISREHVESQTIINTLQSENNNMRLKIDDLTTRINQMEQNSRMNNIEIQCLPEKKEENIIELVQKLGNTISCPVAVDNIAHCSRIAKLNKESSRPRSIIVQFNNARLRDNFLAAAIKFNRSRPSDRLNTTHLNLPGPKTSIYILEHLSVANKNLHAAARVIAKEKGYKYVWVRGGRIYIRKSDDSECKYIKDVASLNKIV